MDYIFYDTSNKLVAAQILEQTEHHFHAKGTGSSVQKIKSKDVLLKGAVALPNAAAIAEQANFQTATNVNLWGKYGSTWDGNSWVAAGVA